jgi:hypothetical protein
MRSSHLTRRRFVRVAGTAALTAAGWARVHGANDRLRVAAVGVGGKGWSDLNGVAASPHVAVAALCDIDETANHLGRAADKFPQARRLSALQASANAAKPRSTCGPALRAAARRPGSCTETPRACKSPAIWAATASS